jgi:hypothetical protein
MAGFIDARTVARCTGPDTAPNPTQDPGAGGGGTYDRQRESVIDERVTFYRKMRHEPRRIRPFRRHRRRNRPAAATRPVSLYVFPQVSLGEILGTEGAYPESDDAYWAINSKRCDILIADRRGNPIAALEYQGSGQNLGGTAKQRDEIKKIALKPAGVQFIEIKNNTARDEIEGIISELLTRRKPPNKAAN